MRKVFFSFHFDRDSWRVGQVRNSWLIRPKNQATPFLDKARWEQIKRQGKENIERWIKTQLSGTSVTVVLIGNKTSTREWVQYEIIESYKRGNGLIGIYIHNLKDHLGCTDVKGASPFDNVYFTKMDGSRTYFSSKYPTYDWISGNGRQNIGAWIESAAKQAGR